MSGVGPGQQECPYAGVSHGGATVTHTAARFCAPRSDLLEPLSSHPWLRIPRSEPHSHPRARALACFVDRAETPNTHQKPARPKPAGSTELSLDSFQLLKPCLPKYWPPLCRCATIHPDEHGTGHNLGERQAASSQSMGYGCNSFASLPRLPRPPGWMAQSA